MATFFNRATLTYNNVTTTSNTVTGEIVGSLTVNKTVLGDTYSPDNTLTYVINLINSGSSAFSGLTLTDDLGTFDPGSGAVTPLTYAVGSATQFVNGIPGPAVTVSSASPLTLTGISVPAGGIASIVYQATVNEFASPEAGAQITNTATLSSALLGTIATADATVTVSEEAVLSIEKALSPSTVSPNGQLTYTFTIRNSGNTDAVATDNVTITDTFDPILSDISALYNGTALEEGTGYTYDESTGLFTTVPSIITVPAASFTRDPATGEWTSTPGVAVVTVTGTI